MSRHERLNKIFAYTLILLLAYLCVEGFFSRVPVFGIYLMPIPAAIIALSVFESAGFGVGFGLAFGLMLDVSTGSPYYRNAVFLMLAAFVCGRVLISVLRQNAVSGLICAFFATLVGNLLNYVLFFMLFDRAHLLGILTYVLPETLLSFIAAVPLILLMYAVHRRLDEAC